MLRLPWEAGFSFLEGFELGRELDGSSAWGQGSGSQLEGAAPARGELFPGAVRCWFRCGHGGYAFAGLFKKMEKERPAVGTPFRPEYARVRVCARMHGSCAGQSNSPVRGRPAGILADTTRPDNNYCCRDASSNGC